MRSSESSLCILQQQFSHSASESLSNFKKCYSVSPVSLKYYKHLWLYLHENEFKSITKKVWQSSSHPTASLI